MDLQMAIRFSEKEVLDEEVLNGGMLGDGTGAVGNISKAFLP